MNNSRVTKLTSLGFSEASATEFVEKTESYPYLKGEYKKMRMSGKTDEALAILDQIGSLLEKGEVNEDEKEAGAYL